MVLGEHGITVKTLICDYLKSFLLFKMNLDLLFFLPELLFNFI